MRLSSCHFVISQVELVMRKTLWGKGFYEGGEKGGGQREKKTKKEEEKEEEKEEGEGREGDLIFFFFPEWYCDYSRSRFADPT